jgi:hypothetical protein
MICDAARYQLEGRHFAFTLDQLSMGIKNFLQTRGIKRFTKHTQGKCLHLYTFRALSLVKQRKHGLR